MMAYGFEDDKFAKSELALAQKLMSEQDRTEGQWNLLINGLGFLYLNCSDAVQPMAQAILQEAVDRYCFLFETPNFIKNRN